MVNGADSLCRGEVMVNEAGGAELALKQRQFNAAMELYSTRSGYRIFGRMVSAANVTLQLYLLFLVAPFP